jgi:transglutaminase-like putative cysteine protease
VLPPGRTRIFTDALVNDTGKPDLVARGAPQTRVEALPEETLLFLLGSRYCETDRLSPLAWQLFENAPSGEGRVQAICDFVHRHVKFGYEFARPTKTAWEAYQEKTGVCRDFAHLAIAFCRCMNIPARYCTGYLGDVGVPPVEAPMDFSGWFEAYLDGKWHVFDARHNTPRIGRILIAYGRDAADVAISNTFGPNTLVNFQVWTDQVTSEGGTDTAPSVESIYTSPNGDRWQLIQDAMSNRAFVRHKANEASGGHQTDLSVAEFMQRDGSGPEHAALRHLISTRVDERERTQHGQ